MQHKKPISSIVLAAVNFIEFLREHPDGVKGEVIDKHFSMSTSQREKIFRCLRNAGITRNKVPIGKRTRVQKKTGEVYYIKHRMAFGVEAKYSARRSLPLICVYEALGYDSNRTDIPSLQIAWEMWAAETCI